MEDVEQRVEQLKRFAKARKINGDYEIGNIKHSDEDLN